MRELSLATPQVGHPSALIAPPHVGQGAVAATAGAGAVAVTRGAADNRVSGVAPKAFADQRLIAIESSPLRALPFGPRAATRRSQPPHAFMPSTYVIRLIAVPRPRSQPQQIPAGVCATFVVFARALDGHQMCRPPWVTFFTAAQINFIG